MSLSYAHPVIVEVRHLRLVRAIHREGTLTRAADSLHVTQPAASRALSDLEGRLGLELFHREPRGMRPTPAGHHLVELAGRVLGLLRQVERELAELRDGERGTLRVTTQCYTCYHWLPRILASFAEDFPAVDLEVAPEATLRPVEAILAEEIDLAILQSPPGEATVRRYHLFRDELVAVVAPEHPLAGRELLEPADFAGEHLIHHSDYADSLLATRVLAPAGVEPRRVSNLQLTEAVIAAVAAGLGTAVLPRWIVAEELRRKRLMAMSLTEEGTFRDWHAAILARRADEPALAALVERLQRGGLEQAAVPPRGV